MRAGHGQSAVLVWRAAAVLLLLAAAALWLSFIYLVQLDLRNSLRGMPGEHSPLRLAMYGLPAALAATGCSLAGYKASTTEGGRSPVAGAVCLALLLGAAAALLAFGTYAQALSEFALLPWKNWFHAA